MDINTQQNVTPASVPGVDTSPYVVVHFPAQGRQLPADHGHALYSAITGQLPALRGASWLGIELLSGVPWREGIIVLPTRGASLRLCIPADRYGYVLPLAGCRLDIAGHPIHLGIPAARPLQPARSLYARIVTIEGFNEPEPVLDAARCQLDALGLKADLEMLIDEQGHFHRHIIKIHERSVIGFSLAAHNLGDDDSLHLQSAGVGENRAMGCGIFNPMANPSTQKEQR
jgi:CRISPR-associated endonuclease/helicase Cas3